MAKPAFSVGKNMDHPHLKGRFTLRIWVPTERTALLVGRGGEVVQGIKQKSHAKSIECPGAEEGVAWAPVVITGDPTSSCKAYQAIARIVEEVDSVAVAEFPLHLRRHPIIVGPGGSTLKRISAENSVRIMMPESDQGLSDSTKSDNNTIRLEGGVEPIFSSLAMIIEAVYGFRATTLVGASSPGQTPPSSTSVPICPAIVPVAKMTPALQAPVVTASPTPATTAAAARPAHGAARRQQEASSQGKHSVSRSLEGGVGKAVPTAGATNASVAPGGGKGGPPPSPPPPPAHPQGRIQNHGPIAAAGQDRRGHDQARGGQEGVQTGGQGGSKRGQVSSSSAHRPAQGQATAAATVAPGRGSQAPRVDTHGAAAQQAACASQQQRKPTAGGRRGGGGDPTEKKPRTAAPAAAVSGAKDGVSAGGHGQESMPQASSNNMQQGQGRGGISQAGPKYPLPSMGQQGEASVVAAAPGLSADAKPAVQPPEQKPRHGQGQVVVPVPGPMPSAERSDETVRLPMLVVSLLMGHGRHKPGAATAKDVAKWSILKDILKHTGTSSTVISLPHSFSHASSGGGGSTRKSGAAPAEQDSAAEQPETGDRGHGREGGKPDEDAEILVLSVKGPSNCVEVTAEALRRLGRGDSVRDALGFVKRTSPHRRLTQKHRQEQEAAAALKKNRRDAINPAPREAAVASTQAQQDPGGRDQGTPAATTSSSTIPRGSSKNGHSSSNTQEGKNGQGPQGDGRSSGDGATKHSSQGQEAAVKRRPAGDDGREGAEKPGMEAGRTGGRGAGRGRGGRGAGRGRGTGVGRAQNGGWEPPPVENGEGRGQDRQSQHPPAPSHEGPPQTQAGLNSGPTAKPAPANNKPSRHRRTGAPRGPKTAPFPGGGGVGGRDGGGDRGERPDGGSDGAGRGTTGTGTGSGNGPE